MTCPVCGAEGLRVKDTRLSEDDNRVRRTRVCPECLTHFRTGEQIERVIPPAVLPHHRKELDP